MPRLTIDGRQVEVEEGATLLDAARKLGLDVPALCHRDGAPPSTSCFVCVMKVQGRNSLVPSCATVAEDGMVVESESQEVHGARKAALELLLSDHLGDCVGPCHALCPAHMNIPLMIRQIAAGELDEAIATVRARIALPAVLGRICPAPCEKGCRRGEQDGPVAICLLKRYVGDAHLAADPPALPAREPATGKAVAIAGAGPAGLAAAWALLLRGHAVTVFDEREEPGGMLRYGVPRERLPEEVLDAEIAIIERLGAQFRSGTRVGRDLSLDELRHDFDAVLLAIGEADEGDAESLGVQSSAHGIEADRQTYRASLERVFAAGGAIRPQRMAVRALAQGRDAAAAIHQLLSGQEVAGPPPLFTTRIGRLKEGEMAAFLAAGASDAPREGEPSGPGGGFTDAEARREALRCLRCDCRKPLSCKLRRYAQAYGASPNRFAGERRAFEQYSHHPSVVYEPGKCIACGLCIRVAQAAGEELGLSFVGRGFRVRVRVPFGRSLEEGLRRAARQAAAACPTGALALRDAAELDR
ncbi:MAG: 2Fe-2S iron-sulfur cluster-binding protein [Candidatus Brocadiia bacterium]